MRFSPKWQQIFSATWPIVLVVLLIVTPFAVKKSWDEMKDL